MATYNYDLPYTAMKKGILRVCITAKRYIDSENTQVVHSSNAVLSVAPSVNPTQSYSTDFRDAVQDLETRVSAIEQGAPITPAGGVTAGAALFEGAVAIGDGGALGIRTTPVYVSVTGDISGAGSIDGTGIYVQDVSASNSIQSDGSILAETAQIGGLNDYITISDVGALELHGEATIGIVGSFAWDVPEIADKAGLAYGGLSVGGAQVGAPVLIGAPYDLVGIMAFGYVTSMNNVEIQLYNFTGAPVTLGAGTWQVRVLR